MTAKISIIVLLLNLFSSLANAGPLGYKEGRWILKAKESYFDTSKNFDKNGVSKDLTNNQSLTLLTTSLSATYDISQNISLFSALDSVYGKSIGYDFSRTRFTPTDFKLGGDFKLLSTIVDIIPELMVTIPIVTVSNTTDELIPSDGVIELKVGGYVSKRFDWFSSYGYLGYASRDDGRSSLMPYEIQMLKSFESFQLTAGVWGYESLSDDTKTKTPAERNIVTARVNGSSFKFYAVNPSVTEAGGSIGFGLGSDIFARAGYSHTILGANTAYGDTFWASLSYSFGGAPTQGPFHEIKRIKEKAEEKKVKEFTPETYEDESVFDEAVILQKDNVQPQAQTPRAAVDSNAKAPVSVKLRAAKPIKNLKKKRGR